ncbi:hypothetical protein B1B04_20670 [Lysinibacillus sp. KCTC 33748]|uniref:hypothetical protein n=1 Tax=unclassified Lysinibacillus TaxID=2636778 RepID=UPI0009A838A4|nr:MULTISPECIES: hypothetical protein [unclassified Lysinibacillus]OXS68536.1 hypothetical protein B1B04_20670 [Lysinibacillus sp. KCTC 33748]SKC10628.1 hypothetical protein SAMN06295926_12369 [Lysinibacillus sp. AC-3]
MKMVHKKNITGIIEKMKNLHINDPTIEIYWDTLVSKFSDEKNTIHFWIHVLKKKLIGSLQSLTT